MGIDVSAYVVVGFSIEDFEFFETEFVNKKKCKKGHETENLKAAYCEYCGEKLSRVSSRTPTEGFKNLCKQYFEEHDPEGMYEAFQDTYDNAVGLFSSEAGWDADKDLFGIRVGSTDSHRNGGGGFTLHEDDVKDYVKKVKGYRNALDISVPVEIHVLLSVG